MMYKKNFDEVVAIAIEEEFTKNFSRKHTLGNKSKDAKKAYKHKRHARPQHEEKFNFSKADLANLV